MPVTGLSWISAGWSPRPAATCRSRALWQVFSTASGYQRYSGAALSSRIRSGARNQSMSAAASRQKPVGSAMLRSYADRYAPMPHAGPEAPAGTTAGRGRCAGRAARVAERPPDDRFVAFVRRGAEPARTDQRLSTVAGRMNPGRPGKQPPSWWSDDRRRGDPATGRAGGRRYADPPADPGSVAGDPVPGRHDPLGLLQVGDTHPGQEERRHQVRAAGAAPHPAQLPLPGSAGRAGGRARRGRPR